MYSKYIKRLLDIVLSFMALIVLSPIFIVLIIVTSIKMKGNPFFIQLRPGKNERIFKLYKLRTMTEEKDKDGNLLPDEKRLTKYGRLLRLTSLDEIPQLINIFKGDMSIVGPRPQLIKDLVFMSDDQRKRHSVRQGLTGLAQVNGRNNVGWDNKFKYDLKYIKNITFIEDVKILIRTVLKVFMANDVVKIGTCSDEDLGDYLLRTKQITKTEYKVKINEAAQIIMDYYEKG